MDRHLAFLITEKEEGQKIQDFLKGFGCSHRVLTHLKRTEDGILLNGERMFASRRLSAGDVLEITAREEAASEQISPVPLPLSILYEDEDLMVIDKPANMPVHPSPNHYGDTLANAAAAYFAARRLSPFVFRCVNRLDRDTSGLLILAKNPLSAAILCQMSADRDIRREYLAIAEGHTPENGTIDAPIGRMEGSALMRCVDPVHGDAAVTHYERLAVLLWPDAAARNTPFPSPAAAIPANAPLPECSGEAVPSPLSCSLLRVRLEMGRTHQIRVHMKHIGHPLLGDFLYNPNCPFPLKRQALHSHTLSFRHPITKEPLRFTSPPPEDLRSYFAAVPSEETQRRQASDRG